MVAAITETGVLRDMYSDTKRTPIDLELCATEKLFSLPPQSTPRIKHSGTGQPTVARYEETPGTHVHRDEDGRGGGIGGHA